MSLFLSFAPVSSIRHLLKYFLIFFVVDIFLLKYFLLFALVSSIRHLLNYLEDVTDDKYDDIT